MFHVPEHYRVKVPGFPEGVGNYGGFRFKKDGVVFFCVASEGMGWEHVSVSLDRRRTPDWDEMCMIKDLFWDEEDCVIQFHPPKSKLVNNHNFCLHLWRKIGTEIPIPDESLIGVK